MSSVESQPVPLGGSRVPESMGGASCGPWQELAEQPLQQPSEGYGTACDLILALREQVGAMKKQLSNLAVPMKTYIYSTEAPDRTALEQALSSVDGAAAAIGAAAAAAAEAAAADAQLPAAVKAEAARVLSAVRSDITQQAADGRALCLVTADKADAQGAQNQQQQQQQQLQPGAPGFAKELYGDFNLQLGPITRKLFSAQTKLLAVIKSIKKNRVAGAGDAEELNN
ncbi:hypothetical protein, conserved [Eimeria brunetti]|uniref:Uncharacterized protein n=1 Tax=Eimeria brunetti TaxID=51314 RepID=U6LW40_9EIME|nr:hypothetical protein, conserved [Eimeria brunetti]